MHNFKDILSTRYLKEVSNDPKNIINLKAESLLSYTYFRIFNRGVELGLQEALIEYQQEYFKNQFILSFYDYDKHKLEVEKKIVYDAGYQIDIELSTKNEMFLVVNSLRDESKKLLISELTKYRKEDIFVTLYLYSSSLSRISTLSAHLFKYKGEDVKEEEKVLDMSNLIIDSIGVIYIKDYVWVNNFLGTLKKNCEYLMANILSNDLVYMNKKIDNLDIADLMIYSELVISNLTIAKSIDSLHKMEYNVGIKNGIFFIQNDVLDKFESYVEGLIDEGMDIMSDNTNILIEQFAEIEGYSPTTMTIYTSKKDGKYLLTNTAMNMLEDKLFYIDFIKKTGASYDEIEKLINVLTLNKCESSEIDNSIFTTDNRLFRTPIIKIDNNYILSNQLLYESSIYLRHRVLKKELSQNGKLNENIKKLFDESVLDELYCLIKEYNVCGGINFGLEVIESIKKSLNTQGIKKELDFYFILDGVLYIAELKNQDIDNSLYDVCKSHSRNIKNNSKHVKMIQILQNNISELSIYMGENISSIRSFLVFKNKNSFSEFYEGEDIYSCNYRDFREFCEVLLKKRNFESVCDGFLIFR